MRLGDSAPDTVKARDVETTLLSYFDDDKTKPKSPDAGKSAEEVRPEPKRSGLQEEGRPGDAEGE